MALDLNAIYPQDFTVLITTSGVGSRLGNLTQYTNKSLIVVGDKPALAHIIEKYPVNTTFVVTLGYFGDHVKEFLELCYPERTFVFVDINPFEGPGSSLGFSILAAKQYLQKPFIYHACDTLILESAIPFPDSNWVAGFKGTDATNYATFDARGECIEKFNAKGMTDFDYIHIGLIGIQNHLEFWSALEVLVAENLFGQALNDVNVLGVLLRERVEFKAKAFDDWIDIGNANSLTLAKKKLGGNFDVLEKPQESVSFIKDLVVKFFAEGDIVSKRVKRKEFLGTVIPEIEGSSEHFFTYRFKAGDLMSNSTNPELISILLNWASTNLWDMKPLVTEKGFDQVLRSFYLDKSIQRLDDFIESRSIQDESNIINGLDVPSARDLIMRSESVLINDSQFGRFHGDFILDNILVANDSFTLIDWRQDFAESLEFGDIYYDLSKLNHSLHINHSLVFEGQFFISTKQNGTQCGILRKDVHVEMEKHLKSFIENKNLSWKKIQIITALIWINMAPLHHHPFDKFLYYYGRYHLWRALIA